MESPPVLPPADADGMRPLTDVEEQWVRLKHSDMKKGDLDRLIAAGLPADTEPITRADLLAADDALKAKAAAKPEPKFFSPTAWAQRKRRRKIAARTRARARR